MSLLALASLWFTAPLATLPVAAPAIPALQERGWTEIELFSSPAKQVPSGNRAGECTQFRARTAAQERVTGWYCHTPKPRVRAVL